MESSSAAGSSTSPVRDTRKRLSQPRQINTCASCFQGIIPPEPQFGQFIFISRPAYRPASWVVLTLGCLAFRERATRRRLVAVGAASGESGRVNYCTLKYCDKASSRPVPVQR